MSQVRGKDKSTPSGPSITNDEMKALKNLFADLLSVTDLDMVRHRDLKRRIESVERELRQAKDDAARSEREIKRLESQDRDIRNDLRALERVEERLKADLEGAQKQAKETESMQKVSSSSASRKLEEIQNQHSREIATLTDKNERKLRELEQDIMGTYEKKLRDLEREAAAAKETAFLTVNVKLPLLISDERDDLRDRLRELEDNFRNQAKSIESQQKAEMDALIQIHRQELSDAVEREKSRVARLRDDLEAEIDDLKLRALNKLTRKIFNVQRIKFRERRQEIADLKLQLETGIKTAEREFQLKLTNETDSLKSKHTAAMDQLQAREMERLRSDHSNTLDELKNRLPRSEAALVTSTVL
ncbi:hypothetical protein HDU76_009400 [Blyttiomyces sp. JEL0837]|nr:hypothetical protein HDU76_009400 [Blyttiomyces sp. JEL0837]